MEKPYLLWLVAGQSNAVGIAEHSIESADYCALFWDWSNQESKALKPLHDPICGSRFKGGSAWPAFARLVFELTGKKSIMLNVAYGASAVTTISSNTWYGESSPRRATATQEWNALSAALLTDEISYELAGLLWIQGEAECVSVANGTIGIQDYIDGTLDVFDYFRDLVNDQNLPIYMSQIGSHTSVRTNSLFRIGYKAVQDAQVNIANNNEKVYLACSIAKEFVNSGMMTDDIHYSQLGYNKVGETMARFVYDYLS